MDVNVTITADDKALEFSRNLSNLFVNLVSGEPITRIDNRAIVSSKKHVEDYPWDETIEPDPIKVDEVKKEYTLEEIRAAGSKYMESHGKEAMKELLHKYGVPKLTVLDPSKFQDVMKEIGE